MIRQSLPTVSKVTASNFKEIVSLDTAAFIAYVYEEDQESRAVFTSVAVSHQDQFIFGIADDYYLAPLGIASPPFIIRYSHLDQVNPVFREGFEVDKIEHFIATYSTPLIGKFSMETYYSYTEVRGSNLNSVHITDI
jgi:protein disulfide-isomerase A1